MLCRYNNIYKLYFNVIAVKLYMFYAMRTESTAYLRSEKQTRLADDSYRCMCEGSLRIQQ